MQKIAPKLSFYFPIVFILCYFFMLGSSLTVQFTGELPCELCLMQRWCMLLTVAGQILILQQALVGKQKLQTYLSASALSMAAAMVGGCIAIHQLILNNQPGHVPFGPAILGIHTWTWSLITFLIVMAYSIFNLFFATKAYPVNLTSPTLVKVITYIYLFIVLLILVLTFFEGGLHNTFIENRYELLYDLGIK